MKLFYLIIHTDTKVKMVTTDLETPKTNIFVEIFKHQIPYKNSIKHRRLLSESKNF